MRLLMRELGVSDCEMQEGSLRCDANVNLHIPPSPPNPLSHRGERGSPNTPPSPSLGGGGGGGEGVVATPITEIKKLNSFRFLERAVRYEAQRQYEEWRANPQYVMGQ